MTGVFTKFIAQRCSAKKTALNNFAKLKTRFENLRRSLLFVVLKLQVIGQQLH